ncbi:MAG TPA: hypothetical protein VNK04_14360 [Gemmataceae bacterium]|nr:hypothetical protein [Gemmataceae bacterium]
MPCKPTCPDLAALAEDLVDLLHGYLPRCFHCDAGDIALDLHDGPFYGPARTPGDLGLVAVWDVARRRPLTRGQPLPW